MTLKYTFILVPYYSNNEFIKSVILWERGPCLSPASSLTTLDLMDTRKSDVEFTSFTT